MSLPQVELLLINESEKFSGVCKSCEACSWHLFAVRIVSAVMPSSVCLPMRLSVCLPLLDLVLGSSLVSASRAELL